MGRPRAYTQEDSIHIRLLNYARIQHKLMVVHVQNEGRRTKHESKYWRDMGGVSGVSDLIILNSRCGYDSLFMELKTDKSKVFTKKEFLKADDTLENQMNFIKKGYENNIIGGFVWSFEMGKQILDAYTDNNVELVEKLIEKHRYTVL